MLYLVGAAFCLGWIGVFVRQIQATSAATLVFYRVFLTVIVLLLWTRRLCPPTSRREWLSLAGFGTLQAATYLLYLSAYRHTTVANAAFLHYLAPVFVLLLAPSVLGERVERRILLALAPALMGTALLTGGDWFSGEVVFSSGDLLATCSALTYAGYTVMARATGHRTGALRMTLWVHLMGLPVIILFNLVMHHGGFVAASCDWPYVLLLAFVSTTLAFILFFRGLQMLPASQGTLIMLLTPVISALLAWLLLDEPLPPRQGVGAIFIVLAAFLAQSHRTELQKRKSRIE
ncbi:MAG: DMT family transporter [Anaerolineae bacterium]